MGNKNVNGDVLIDAYCCVYAQTGIYIPTRAHITVCARTLLNCEKTKSCGFELTKGTYDVAA